MSVYKRGGVYHYRFTVRGERYRGSTGQAKLGRARTIESMKIAEAMERGGGPFDKAPVLSDFSVRFFAHIDKIVASDRLAPNTRKTYRCGWNLLAKTAVAGMRVDEIEASHAAELRFEGSASKTNMVLRTLSRMLSYACEVKIMRARPTIELREENEREVLIEPWLEELLLEFAPDHLAAIIIIMLDCGLRPEEVVRMRWEHVLWDRGVYFNAFGKTKRARRYVGLTDRMRSLLRGIQNDQEAASSEWVFPSDGGKSHRPSASGHRTSASKAWGLTLDAITKAIAQRNLKGDLTGVVLYSCRHTYATNFLGAGGELSKLCMLMGHSSIVVTQKYLHPSTAGAAEVMNRHNRNKAGLRIVKSA